ncbi:MAG: Zn-ribbon domain-containing OB-fold protein [Chloroflexi bacterium]|nr:Zn-ribbon domain-containing OB-fold protein [Chloroflexota bacterium]
MRPYIDLDNQGYWDAVKNHKLVLQYCTKCNRFIHPPRPMCPTCRSQDTMEWKESSGKGILYSYVMFTSPKMAYPAYELPYAVVLVELEEGVRIVTNTHEIEPDEVQIGLPVEVMFEDLPDGQTVYRFKKREA